MRVFDFPNTDGEPCPICGTVRREPVTLVPKPNQTGRTQEAWQVHLSCIELRAENLTEHGPTHVIVTDIFVPKDTRNE